jgi:hypothetical protein
MIATSLAKTAKAAPANAAKKIAKAPTNVSVGESHADEVISVGKQRFDWSFSAMTVGPPLQRKPSSLAVNDPADSYEREADRAADQVMAAGSGRLGWTVSRVSVTTPLQRSCPCGGECDDCKKDALRRKANIAATPATAPDVVHDVLRGPGQPLDPDTRSFMESRFSKVFGKEFAAGGAGYDLSHVRIHVGSGAQVAARSVNARAFTVGSSIVFGSGEYSPHTPGGQRLLAHELTHVIQQSSGPVKPTVQRLGVEDAALDLGGEALAKFWLHLSPEHKASLVDRAIGAFVKFVDLIPGKNLGTVWELLQEGVKGFLGRLGSASAASKVGAADKIASIIAGEDPQFTVGYAKGILKGFFIDGALGIFIAVWDLVKGIKALWDFLKGVPEIIQAFPEDIQAMIANWDEVQTQIGPAIEEAKNLFLNPDQAGAFMAVIGEKAKALAKEGGEKIAQALLDFFTQPGASAQIGETIGDIVGMALWEVVFAVVTEGGGAAVTAAKAGMKETAEVLAKLFGKVAGGILKAVEEVGAAFRKVVKWVKGGIEFAKGKLAEIGGKFGELLEKLEAFFTKVLELCVEHSPVSCKAAKLGKKTADVLRREARKIFFEAYPKLKGKVLEVHHRIPLEWRKLFPQADPNRLANLQGLTKADHLRKASDLWDAFRATFKKLGRDPTPIEVLQYAGTVDRSLDLPLWLPSPLE